MRRSYVAPAIVVALILLAPTILSSAAALGTFASVFRWMMVTVFPWIVILELCLLPALAYATALIGMKRADLHS